MSGRGWFAAVALLWGLSGVAFGQCSLDLKSGTMENPSVRLALPKVGSADPVRIYRHDRAAVPDHWYCFNIGGTQTKKAVFRSRGKVLGVEALTAGPDLVKVRVTRLTDDPQEPELGQFEMGYEIRRDQPVVYHDMTFAPRRPIRLLNYEFFVATEEKPAATTHRFHFVEPGWKIGSTPAKTTEQYGRIAFPDRHPWLALEEIASRRMVAVGAPPADVMRLNYAIEFKRFELSRKGRYLTPDDSIKDFSWIGFGEDANELLRLQRRFEEEPVRPARTEEPAPFTPDLARRPPAAAYGRQVSETGTAFEIQADDFRLTVDKQSGAIVQLETAAGPVLDEPGGLVFVKWPERKRIGPAGKVSNARVEHARLSYDWKSEGLVARNALNACERRVLWTVSLTNAAREDLLVEARMALPLRLGTGPWFYWDGLQLESVDAGTRRAEMTTLVPGETCSQGIFPAVCLHNDRQGMAVGLDPMDIESFYGSRVCPAEGALDTFCYAVRLALPPGKTREVRFVLFAVDPNWSWRSCVERYWSFWPEVFAAPGRDDIWGLYSTNSPDYIFHQGDKFIEMCRRLRVGGMELYGPFSKTGDFYPDSEPAMARKNVTLSRADMRGLFETANIASCNLCYVIPTKCERELAKARYSDSIVRLSDGAPFLSDSWDVMGGHREKLAAMFAWGDSFGANMRTELRQIVSNYGPEGFYMDNGAFVWQDYGRVTEWSAFDDEGRVYTNAGIAYAKLLDDLREFAPAVQRNPGEFIQYFSGFRAQSHLTNCTWTQPHYIRSHRLIMGYKPIFPGNPSRFGVKADVLEALEFGGLLWLAVFKLSQEPLARAWAPVAVALARAGWRPVPGAVADAKAVRVERFGEGEGTLFAVRNLSEETLTAKLVLAGAFPALCDFHSKVAVQPKVNAETGCTEVSVQIPNEDMVVLRAAPPKASPPKAWPKAAFLADARPASIVVRPDATQAERRTARRVKGFIEVQAEVLKRPAEVEIVEQAAAARYPYRVIIVPGQGATTIEEAGADTLKIAISDEDVARHVLSDFLDTLEQLPSGATARWEP